MPKTERFLFPASLVAIVAGGALLAVSMTATIAAPAPSAAAAPRPPISTTTTVPSPLTTVAAATATVPPETVRPETVPRETVPPSSEPLPPEPLSPGATTVERAVAYARAQLGRPYWRGADGPDAFDCSGLTRAAYRSVGIDLPGYSVAQASMGRAVNWRYETIRPGDLVFVRGDTPVIDLGHVGLAISATQWIVAPRTGQPVQIAAIPIPRIQRVRRMVGG